MEVINNATNESEHSPLDLAATEVMAQFGASDRKGTALWRPSLPGGAPAPDCMAWFERLGRFIYCFFPGRYRVENDVWRLDDDHDGSRAVADPLETVWDAAMAVKNEITKKENFHCFIYAVAVFPDMARDADILAARGGRGGHILWRGDDLVEQSVNMIPKGKEWHSLDARYIQNDVRTLSRVPRPTKVAPAPDGEVQVDLGSGLLQINGVESVVIHVHLNPDGPRVYVDDPLC